MEFLAVVALSQDSTTNCTAFGMQVTCRTTEQPSGLDAYNAAREAAARSAPAPRVAGPDPACAGGDWLIAGCSYGAHREAREAREAQQRVSAARAETMRLLQAGDCQGAVRASLQTNDLSFAREVRDFCAP